MDGARTRQRPCGSDMKTIARRKRSVRMLFMLIGGARESTRRKRRSGVRLRVHGARPSIDDHHATLGRRAFFPGFCPSMIPSRRGLVIIYGRSASRAAQRLFRRRALAGGRRRLAGIQSKPPQSGPQRAPLGGCGPEGGRFHGLAFFVNCQRAFAVARGAAAAPATINQSPP